MEDKRFKNTIIALSGEPVAGKGTTVKALIEKLKERGYTDKQIHLYSTGQDFRRYFNSIIDMILNLDNEEELKKISERKELQELFNNEYCRQTLSISIANLIEKQIDLAGFSIEQANNRSDFKDIRKSVDRLIDEGMKEKGKNINKKERPNEIWIIDSRLAFYNIPDAFSVRLTTSPDVAGERLFNDKSRGKEDSQYESEEEAKKEREERKNGENARYLQRYGIDLTDENNYNLIIDTSYSSPSDIADVILQCVKCYEQNKKFAKKWASPKTFIPLQNERDTLSRGMSGYNFEEIVASIDREGYLPDRHIEVVNVDGLNYIIEGHHRNFAVAYLGKTLIPYEVIATNEEKIPIYGNTARNRAETISLSYLYGHEGLIAKGALGFSYSKMFPELYKKLQERNVEPR